MVTTIGLIALVAPPNNWDSMTYHMSRVMHWIQNQSVSFYPTHILRQLHQNPWAEFAIMHFQILSDSDRFANIIQWFSMIGSIVGVSLIAKQLGANSRGQVFAAVVVVSIPMGILQASSTQNDYVVSFWLVCFVYYSMLLTTEQSLADSIAAGASLGLAILTKATAYIYALPFLLWSACSILKRLRWRAWKPLLVILTVTLLLNFGHYARNFELFGNPLGPGQESPSGVHKYTNDQLSVSIILSNCIRNVGLHIGTPIKQLNAITEKAIYSLHGLLNIDPNDPRTTWAKTKFRMPSISYSEDLAGNPTHLVLIVISIMVLVFWKQLRDSRNLIRYFIALTTAFLLFCVVLKWQPWHSRLHLPIFVLWSPLIGIVLSRTLNSRKASIVILLIILTAIPWILYNKSRPLIRSNNVIVTRRIVQYFMQRPELKDPYNGVANFLNSQTTCEDIGLMSGGDSWEYPFWVLLEKNGVRTIRIEHVNVTNPSGTIPIRFNPCAIISTLPIKGGEIATEESLFYRELSAGPISVFLRE